MKQHELNLESKVFTELRNMISSTLQNTVKAMKDKQLSEGTITAKIKIGLMTTVDENGEIHSTVIFEPKVSAKIGNSAEEKCGATGGRISLGDDGELLIGSEQVTMDELLDEQKGA